ncbi:MAG: cytochrome c biogenesis heme-transporting ATPase CcmA [Salinisphaera sp.]|uniref:cytochrome c biogenesis heme-transporting ATPase CcmA n=1 Tax=Salinisphaera sp. TaxID=1914330 RepID=UPI003C7B2ECC
MISTRLDIIDLTCGRGERALFSRLNVCLKAGEVGRVLGENGSGKTTLLRTVAGLYQPMAGRIRWRAPARPDGEPTLLRDDLCFVGHDNALNSALTPVENLSMLMHLSGRGVSRRVVEATLSELGLERVGRRPCGRLSAGQRRRVSLARLWMSDAPLWLLDEPASALDGHARTVLAARIAAHAKAGGVVLFTTHEGLPLPNVEPRTIDLPAC